MIKKITVDDCPFCGSDAYIVTDSHGLCTDGDDVHCDECARIVGSMSIDEDTFYAHFYDKEGNEV